MSGYHLIDPPLSPGQWWALRRQLLTDPRERDELIARWRASLDDPPEPHPPPDLTGLARWHATRRKRRTG